MSFELFRKGELTGDCFYQPSEGETGKTLQPTIVNVVFSILAGSSCNCAELTFSCAPFVIVVRHANSLPALNQDRSALRPVRTSHHNSKILRQHISCPQSSHMRYRDCSGSGSCVAERLRREMDISRGKPRDRPLNTQQGTSQFGTPINLPIVV